MRTFERFKSFFSSEENGRNMKRNNKCVAHNAWQSVNKMPHIRLWRDHVCDRSY